MKYRPSPTFMVIMAVILIWPLGGAWWFSSLFSFNQRRPIEIVVDIGFAGWVFIFPNIPSGINSEIVDDKTIVRVPDHGRLAVNYIFEDGFSVDSVVTAVGSDSGHHDLKLTTTTVYLVDKEPLLYYSFYAGSMVDYSRAIMTRNDAERSALDWIVTQHPVVKKWSKKAP